MDVVFGDASDAEFLATLPLRETRWLVCTVRHASLNRLMWAALQEAGYGCRLAMSASDASIAEWLQERGVSLVMTPYHDAADAALSQLTELFAVEPQSHRDMPRLESAGLAGT